MAAITVSGTVTKCELKRMIATDYRGMRKYSPNSESYLYRLNVCVTTPEGKRFFFNSPAYGENVANCPVAAIVTYHPENKDAINWFKEIAGSGVATTEKANTNGIEPLVKVGDAITVRGSVKAEKPTYTSLNRIKMIPASR